MRNYAPQAAGSLAAELTEAFPGVVIEKVESSGGRFEVSVDGGLVFSKASTGRFPAYQEIPKLVVEALS